ncbi:MAG: glycosyltransferase family 39 protein [Flavobacteriales bacterium]|jgi:4-amino-4-deoxy-L-arabinose transferase-like glycosyltransferase|nr:glycosyltransferase family 39 protein [Flavobacteriales bacterium]
MKKYLNQTNILLFIIVLIGAILRIWNLDYLTLWTDEHMHVDGAQKFIQNGNFDGLIDKNGILLTYSIIPFFSIFGVEDFWARFPSFLYGVGAIILLFKLAKLLFNTRVALISALLVSVSTYYVFWSKLARNYSIYIFFALITTYLFVKIFLYFDANKKNIPLLKKLKVNPIPILLFIVSFFLTLMAHQLAFFLIFGWMSYFLITSIKYLITKEKSAPWLTKKTLFLVPAIFLFTMIFIQPMTDMVKPLLSIVFHSETIEWFMPNWDYISQLWEKDPYKSFDIYKNVILTDMPLLWPIGFVGFALAIWRYKERGIFILSMFLPYVLLMSFVFREPFLPRYLVEAYLYLIMAIAIGIDELLSWLSKYIKQPKLQSSLTVIGLVLVVLLSNIQQTIAVTATETHGQVAPKELSQWYFADWKSPVIKLKKVIKKGDIVLTTHPTNTKHYLKTEDKIYWFRQRKLDVKTRKYVPMLDQEDLSDGGHGHSLAGIQKLMNDHDRGWILGDYYFHNVMTDPNVRNFIYQNTNYYYDLGNDGLMVFGWDKSKPKQNNMIVEEMGRSNKIQSQEYRLPAPTRNGDRVNIWIEAEGVDFSNELNVVINRKAIFGVDVNARRDKSKPSIERNIYTMSLPASAFVQGPNSIIFQANPKIKRQKMQGVIVFNMGLLQ